MGVVILQTAVVRPTWWPLSHGARRTADTAVSRCLASAGTASADLDMLLNVGVYRERGLGEPALAAMIQDDVDVDGDLRRQGSGTFSFDVDNGLCGTLTGLDVLRGLISSGAVRLGLVVASDSGPGPVHAHDLPRPEAGAALLLGLSGAASGLSRVELRTFPEYAGLLEGYWEWRSRSPRPGIRAHGANRLVVLERPGFAARAVECAADTVSRYLCAAGLTAGDVDLLVASPEPGFADPLADMLGIDHAAVLHAGEAVGAMHTAQPIAAIDTARRSGRWSEARTILIVGAASGITIGCALYRH